MTLIAVIADLQKIPPFAVLQGRYAEVVSAARLALEKLLPMFLKRWVLLKRPPESG
jgi:hypothetical protein